MYRILSVVLFLFLFSNVQANERNLDKQKSRTTIIAGRLPSQSTASSIELTIADQSDIVNPQGIVLVQNIHRRQFKFHLSIDHPVYIRLENNEFSREEFLVFGSGRHEGYSKIILVEPGDSIFIDCISTSSKNKVKQLEFSGRGASKLNCSRQIIDEISKFKRPSSIDRNYHEVALFLDSALNSSLRILSKFKSKISNAAYTILKVESLLDLIGRADAMYPKEIPENALLQIRQEEKICSLVLQIKDSNAIHARFSEYEVLVFFKLLQDIRAQKPFSLLYRSDPIDTFFYNNLNVELSKSPLRSRIIGSYLFWKIGKKGATGQMDSILNNFSKNSSSSDGIARQLISFYQTFKNRVKKGSPAYNFSLPDTLGNIVRLTDFRGKNILMDFMYTGCTGCANMVPSLTTVENKFRADTSIVFISISIDKNKQYQNSGPVKYSVPGSLFLYTEGKGEYHDIIKYYSIQGYPTLVLIDKEGKLVADRVPDPRKDNGAKLIDLINEQIKSK